MATPFLGEIRLFAGNFNPEGWAFCNGQLMAISQFSALFQLIGTTYGGDGTDTFGLPDLRSRVPVHQSATFPIGQLTGSESVTLTTQQIPSHNHNFVVSQVAGANPSPSGNLLGASASMAVYTNEPPATLLNAATVQPNAGSQPHNNIQPYQCVTFIIALEGIFPTQ